MPVIAILLFFGPENLLAVLLNILDLLFSPLNFILQQANKIFFLIEAALGDFQNLYGLRQRFLLFVHAAGAADAAIIVVLDECVEDIGIQCGEAQLLQHATRHWRVPILLFCVLIYEFQCFLEIILANFILHAIINPLYLPLILLINQQFHLQDLLVNFKLSPHIRYHQLKLLVTV